MFKKENGLQEKKTVLLPEKTWAACFEGVKNEEEILALLEVPLLDFLCLIFTHPPKQEDLLSICEQFKKQVRKEMVQWRSPFLKGVACLRFCFQFCAQEHQKKIVKKIKKQPFLGRVKFLQRPELLPLFKSLPFEQQGLLLLHSKYGFSWEILSHVFGFSIEHLKLKKYFAMCQLCQAWKS